MIPSSNKDTLKLLKDIRAFLGSVEIPGYEAINYAACMNFLNFWIALSEKTPENTAIKEKLKKRREKYKEAKQGKKDLETIEQTDKQTDNGWDL